MSKSIKSFFSPKPTIKATPRTPATKNATYSIKPFVLKQGMILAPTVRTKKFTKEQAETFESCIGISDEIQNCDPIDQPREKLYVSELRNGKHRPRHGERTRIGEPDVMLIVDDAPSESTANKENNSSILESQIRTKKLRRKLLQFHDNRRPSKYGVWLTVSRKVKGRRPLAKDDGVFDYAVDSDDEWEDEGEGDDCQSDENDEDADQDDLNDTEKAFFVDHGYLSPEENVSDEEDGDPESRHERGKLKLLTFEADMDARKAKHLRLVAHGPYWPGVQEEDPNWSLKLNGFKTVKLTSGKPISTSFTPGLVKPKPKRSAASSALNKTKTPKSKEPKAKRAPKASTPAGTKTPSVKRKNQEKTGDGGGTGEQQQPKKRAVLIPSSSA